MTLPLTFTLLYLSIGLVEYSRLKNEYNRKLREDFPYHNADVLKVCPFLTLVLFSFPLIVAKFSVEFLRWCKRIFRRMTFPYRLWRFRRMLEKAADEKDAEKSVRMIFEAMTYIAK